MAIIERDDGALFISPSYRELLSAKKKSLLKKEVYMLSENYGKFVYLRKKNVSQYEAVFDSEAGYPLGETVWRYLDKPDNLVYCEECPGGREVILVIIKFGSVYLDAKLPIESVGEELIALRSQKNKFKVYIYGGVPISEKRSTTKFFFDEKSIDSFTVLDSSLFNNLVPYENLALKPVKEALASAGFGPISIRPFIIPVIIILFLYFGYNYITTHKKILPKVLIGVVDPYARYLSSLSTPNPVDEIRSFINDSNIVLSLSGVSVKNLSLTQKDGFKAGLDPNGVSLSMLYSWVERTNMIMTVDNSGVTLQTDDDLSNRPAPTAIYNLQSSLRIFIDRIKTLSPEKGALTLGEASSFSQFSEVPVTITFSDATLSTLYQLSKEMEELPLTFVSITAANDNGLLSGSINLTILGN